MTISNAPNGLSSFGVPLTGNLPFRQYSQSFFVDAEKGSDYNRGIDPDKPLATLSKAHSLAVAGRNDRVFLIGNGQASGSARESATLTWSKDQTHLIGIGAPTAIGQRARIATTASVNFSPLMNITADGCVFSNFSMFHGYDDASTQIALQLTGALRNYFHNVCVQGMGHATAGDQAGSASLALSASSENMFEDCTIGLDTIARSTTNAEIVLAAASTRNMFKKCLIPTFADNAGHIFVKIASAADIDRFVLFDDCLFMNAIGSTATAMTAAITVHASAGGHVILKDCGVVGATDWAASTTALIKLLGAAPDTSLTGLAVSSTT